MKSEKNGGLNLNAATKRQKTVPNDIVPNKTICTALCSNINDASHTDKICQTLTNKTININGKDFKNHEFAHSESVPKSAESYLTSNVCQRLKINSLEAVNHKTDNVSLLRNKIHEEKLEHDQYVADRENKKNGVREKYDKWKEGLEKKRKLSVKSINSSRQPLCDFHSG